MPRSFATALCTALSPGDGQRRAAHEHLRGPAAQRRRADAG